MITGLPAACRRCNFGLQILNVLASRNLVGGMMALSPDAIRLFEQDLLQKADVLAIGLKGLRSADAGRAAELLSVITDRLEGAISGDFSGGAEPAVSAGERQKPLLVAS